MSMPTEESRAGAQFRDGESRQHARSAMSSMNLTRGLGKAKGELAKEWLCRHRLDAIEAHQVFVR